MGRCVSFLFYWMRVVGAVVDVPREGGADLVMFAECSSATPKETFPKVNSCVCASCSQTSLPSPATLC